MDAACKMFAAVKGSCCNAASRLDTAPLFLPVGGLNLQDITGIYNRQIRQIPQVAADCRGCVRRFFVTFTEIIGILNGCLQSF